MGRIRFFSLLIVVLGNLPAAFSAAVSCDAGQPATPADFKRVQARFSGDTLGFSLPSRFGQVSDERLSAVSNANSQLKAWSSPATPAGDPPETIEIRSLKSPTDPAMQTSVSRLAAIHAKMVMASCPDTFSFGTLPALMRDTPGDETYAVVLACGNVRISKPRRSDISVSYFLRGASDFYVVTWSVLGDPRDKAFDINRNDWQQRITSLFPMTVCPANFN